MIDINSPADLADKILSADIAIVDYWATWCAPCRAMAPALESLQAANPGLVIGKVNIEQNQELAKAAGIRSIPTLMLFKNGELKSTMVGAHGQEALQEFVNQAKA